MTKNEIIKMNNELNNSLNSLSKCLQEDLRGIVQNIDSSWQSNKGNVFRDRINTQVGALSDAVDQVNRICADLAQTRTTVEVVEHIQKNKITL